MSAQPPTWVDHVAGLAAVEGLRFRVAGRRRSVASYVRRHGVGEDLARLLLTQALASELYERYFIRDVAPVRRSNPRPDVLEADLKAANRGVGPWEPGWTVLRDAGAKVVVSRDGLTFSVRREAVRISEDRSAAVRRSPELARYSPGFYMLLSDEPFDLTSGPVLRTYWHLSAAGAPAFVAAVSTVLNAAAAPFRAKVISSSDAFDRSDAGVIYTPRDRWHATALHLVEIERRLRPFLRPRVPAMTSRLTDGVGLAEGPPQGRSFGMSRCELIAGALVRVSVEGDRTAGARAAGIVRAFREAGLTPDRPHLQPNSGGRYEWPI